MTSIKLALRWLPLLRFLFSCCQLHLPHSSGWQPCIIPTQWPITSLKIAMAEVSVRKRAMLLLMRKIRLIGVELASNFTTSCQISGESLIVSFVGTDVLPRYEKSESAHNVSRCWRTLWGKSTSATKPFKSARHTASVCTFCQIAVHPYKMSKNAVRA